MSPRSGLAPEEKLAVAFGRNWRTADYRPELRAVDGRRFAQILCHNRMAVLGLEILQRSGAQHELAWDALQILRQQADEYQVVGSSLGGALTTYLELAASRGIDTIVLKGLWMCDRVYGHPSLRPGSDIDILVRRGNVSDCLAALREQGIGAYWPNLLKDAFFARHHLHQQRSTPDLSVWFEVHWALDHPYTLLTVDYEGIFGRARPGRLRGAPVMEMSPADLILTLAIHLVKHAVYLPSVVQREDLARIILADGMLMYYIDVSESLEKFQHELDWVGLTALARSWGMTQGTGSVLRACREILQACVPDEVLAALPLRAQKGVTRWLMERAANQQLAVHEGRRGSGFWRLLLSSNGAFILRPIRALEVASYLFPPGEFLRRRYGRADGLTRVRHWLIAVLNCVRFLSDTLYFGAERYWRLKRAGKRTSLFNRLDTDL